MDKLKTKTLASKDKKTMNNQKDEQKDIYNKDTNSYGHGSVSSSDSFNNKLTIQSPKPIYEFVNKKTEKIVTALYMVTDCMDTDDALKGKLRLLSVELLSDMYKLSALPPMDKNNHISISVARVYELISFIDIASMIGFISEMNSTILSRELNNLITELKSHETRSNHFSFTLSEKMFEVERPLEENKNIASMDNIKDNYKGQNIKDKVVFPISLKSSFRNQARVIDYKDYNKNLQNKDERANKILAIIKDSKNNLNQNGVSIKDVSVVLTDCSEKTIQRELNVLVSKGLIKKTGAKRWSRYQTIAL